MHNTDINFENPKNSFEYDFNEDKELEEISELLGDDWDEED